MSEAAKKENVMSDGCSDAGQSPPLHPKPILLKDCVIQLQKRVEALERKVKALDSRTVGQIRYGGKRN